ncbi:MAG: hypothetical protein E7438_05790 [Ruminococcaceae bacterium]|nr:hypothetical protein [Oscillospiraceae bacterium]
MKKLIPILLAFLLLTGCTLLPEASSTYPPLSLLPSKAPSSTPTAPTTAPTQPALPECEHTQDQYANVDKDAFYASYTPSCCWEDAQLRSDAGLLSGLMEVPQQMFTRASYQPTENGVYVRNESSFYEDNGNTYVVVDGYGVPVLRIYKGGGYITLEEVAAYMYAFGGSADNMPANYTANKKPNPSSNPWGKYLRANHSNFSGNTSKYPYEPELPNINGCGGRLQYFEMDIGTTGTSTPGQNSGEYNNGSRIVRGAARLVYARQDLNGNGIYEQGEVYVFYTHNHYNDFTEYLNYFGGWGLTFGNVTGGGTFDSKTDCNPTPYPEVVYWDLLQEEAA